MKNQSIISLITILLCLNSCEKSNPKPSVTNTKYIIENHLKVNYKRPCDVGFGSDTVVGYINFDSKDSKDSNSINVIKVYSINRTFPDSFLIVKGFTWKDYRVVSTPPQAINGIKVTIEPNNTISCKITDLVQNSKTSKLYIDTIKTQFKLGKYDDVVNLKGYIEKTKTEIMKIHLPTFNNLGNNTFELNYDTLGIDSGYMIGEINLSRSTPDSALQTLSITMSIASVCGKTYTINFNNIGNYTISSNSSTGGCNQLFIINSIIKNNNNYKIRFKRTIDGALTSRLNMIIKGYAGCDGISDLKKKLIEKTYNY